MYFDRKGIKGAAKVALKRSHWMVVVVMLIAGLLGGTLADGATGSTFNFNIDLPSNIFEDSDTGADPDIWAPGADEDYWEGDEWQEDDDAWGNIYRGDEPPASNFMDDRLAFLFGAVLIVFMVALLFAVVWSVFLGNIITVGSSGWLMRYWRGETPGVGELFASFRIYKPSLLAMLVRSVYTFLWSLLFLIPGIVKAYSYSMVPYIIYENPNLSPNQAITMSQKMTDGYKADLFVFDLSYFGWAFLSAITGGILGALYVNPYIGVAHAGIYEDLKQKAIQNGRLTWADFGQTPPVIEDPWASPVYDPSIPTYTPPQEPNDPPQW